MTEVVEIVHNKELDIHGDGRFDSPGHSALYGTYTFMDAHTSLIVMNSVVKVSRFLI